MLKKHLTIIILSTLLVMSIGFVIWAYVQNNKIHDSLDVAQNSLNGLQTRVDSLTQENEALKKAIKTDTIPYVDIPQFGIRISFESADKVMIGGSGTNDFGITSVGLKLKPKYTSDPKCQELSIGFSRYSEDPELNARKVGPYYYDLNGSPYICGDGNINSEINQLRSKIISEELGVGNYIITSLK
jgi:hypothetical protein